MIAHAIRQFVLPFRNSLAAVRAAYRARCLSCFGALDSPRPNECHAGIVHVRGWLLSQSGESIELELRVDGVSQPIAPDRFPRSDLAKRYPSLGAANRAPGFTFALNTAGFADGPHELEVVARSGSKCIRIGQVPIQAQNVAENAFYRRVHTQATAATRAAKMRILANLLTCPNCQHNLPYSENTCLQCPACNQGYEVRDGVPILVVHRRFPIEAEKLQSPASNHGYPPAILEELERTLSAGGLALDFGSGRRSFGSDRLVQVEICAYPFADVVSQSDELPFRDSAFDFVFSLAVTEHVRRPWVLAGELQRVLKPGGRLHVDSAFLQPLHGYPNHYYNMTDLALADLFQGMETLSLQPAAYQHPFFSLTWILERLLVDVPPMVRQRLMRLRFEEFLGLLRQYVNGTPSLLNEMSLPSERVQELAAGFTLQAKKPKSAAA